MSQIDFEHSQEYLKNFAAQILDKAITLGATSAEIAINESIDTSIEVLNSNIDSFETSYSSYLSLFVYKGHQKGYVSLSKIAINMIDEIVTKALEIAKYTESDIHNGIAESRFLCNSIDYNLQLFNPVEIDNFAIVAKAKELEQLALNSNSFKLTSDGASLNLNKRNFLLATTNNFNMGYQTTKFSKHISLIGENKSGLQTDYWYDSARSFTDLMPDQKLVNKAIYRLARRLNKGKISAGSYNVIFDAPIAKSFMGYFLEGISGNSLFRRLSFLNDTKGTQIFPNWLNIIDNPSIIKGNSSCYFDSEGVRVTKRHLVANGVVEDYILDSYTGRKLNLNTTGNAGGVHNVQISYNFDGEIEKFAQLMHNGLIIIEIVGQGLNLVNGDYSFGAGALLVEHGEIKYYIDNLTIAGNLKDFYKNIKYINNDFSPTGTIQCGAILVDNINVAN
ncbi:MAG: metalloprotease PmbA [Pseudomonadota bacterium]|jgi:PmbA protein|nr:metallopeptidase TldD-related protein [Burkholderiales bacterium]